MQNDPFYLENHVALIASSILQSNAHYTLYLLHIFLYPISPTCYGALYFHHQGELRILVQNCQLYKRLLHNIAINNKL